MSNGRGRPLKIGAGIDGISVARMRAAMGDAPAPTIAWDTTLAVQSTGGGTTIEPNNVPAHVQAGISWVVIGPGDTECEVKKITARSGKTLTVGTLTNTHDGGDPVIFLPDFRGVNVHWFGATGDGTTDDTAALQASLDSAAALGLSAAPGGLVLLSGGDFLFSYGLLVPDRVVLRGIGAGASGPTRLHVASGFDFSTYDGAIRLGTDNDGTASTDDCFGCRLEHIHLNLNAQADGVGIVSDSINEQSGLYDVTITGVRRYGIWFNNGSVYHARNFLLEHVRIGMASATFTAGAANIKIEGDGNTTIKYANDITCYNGSGTNVGNNMELDGCSGLWSNLHFENGDIGLSAGASVACPGLHIAGVTGGGSMTTVVQIENTAGNDVLVSGVLKRTATNGVNDALNGITIADDVSLYSAGQIVGGANISVKGSALGGLSLGLDDDNATSFTPYNTAGMMMISSSGGGGGVVGALIVWRATASPVCKLINQDSSGIFAVTTGALAGTTGTDTKVTISTHTDGKIYVENRSGSTASLKVVLFNA